MNSPVSTPPPDTIDLKPNGQTVYGRTDGSKVEKELTTGDIEFTNEMTPGPIIGDAHAEPMLDVTASRRSESESTHRFRVRRRWCRSGSSGTRRDE